MSEKLILLIYPKHNRTACLVMKNDNYLYRINHVWHYPELADELELICTKIGKGMIHYQCLDLCDKRSGDWAVVCNFTGLEGSILLWNKSIDPKAKKPVFSWSGTVATFQRAVANLLKMLR
jgi:hypothetical protein